MVDSAATGVKKTAVSALVAAETISVLGTRMTYLALPWFVLVTTGSPGKMSFVLAAEILPMAILGIPSGVVVQRLGSRTTMLIADAARAPILASIPLLHAAGVLSFGLLLGIVALLGCFMPPYFASQRTILPGARRRGRDAHVAGEQRDRRRKRLRRTCRPRPCRCADPVHRGVERAVRRRGDLPRRLRSRPGLRAATEAGRSGGSARRHGRARAFFVATRCLRRWPPRSSSSGS